MIYRGNKIELDGMKFDSKVEAQFYQRFIKPSGKRFLFHPSALCMSAIRIMGSLCGQRDIRLILSFKAILASGYTSMT